MKIIATNLAKPTTIKWNNKDVVTGIYKTPTNSPIFLGKTDVDKDEVTDRKYHGGEFKACYIFSEKHYDYWKNLYPNLDWNWGMFGENLTISNFDESEVFVGSIYKIGEALVQITQPREPCFKLGVKFGNQNILKAFIDHGFPGTYIRILKEGFVKTGDYMVLEEEATNSLTISEMYNLLYAKEKDQNLLKLVIKNDALPQKKRDKLAAYLK
ncbi:MULTISPECIES: MOSC domain-containing protein [unclassified Algibacter]|uniref:MOSC domain-containing protein n=1 Tax=unclassified Algibacter TaxID=2615009 RepID=UPI00131DD0F9|nr:MULTISPECIES: MOSC domain-containing protein [unclassified Algibacter]MCL5128813.1 MOSC domain-containing protein [Algibacter sp. L4_22]